MVKKRLMIPSLQPQLRSLQYSLVDEVWIGSQYSSVEIGSIISFHFIHWVSFLVIYFLNSITF